MNWKTISGERVSLLNYNIGLSILQIRGYRFYLEQKSKGFWRTGFSQVPLSRVTCDLARVLIPGQSRGIQGSSGA